MARSQPRGGVPLRLGGLPSPSWVSSSPKGKTVEIDAIADPERVSRIAATVLKDE
jgi:hypothetical protein